MKLQQGQLWKLPEGYVRIVVLERLAVQYKALKDPGIWEGSHHQVTKKEFCRLIKDAALISEGRKSGPSGTQAEGKSPSN